MNDLQSTPRIFTVRLEIRLSDRIDEKPQMIAESPVSGIPDIVSQIDYLLSQFATTFDATESTLVSGVVSVCHDTGLPMFGFEYANVPLREVRDDVGPDDLTAVAAMWVRRAEKEAAIRN